MDSLTERGRQELSLVEDAMRTYPLANTPSDFASMVMTRIRGTTPAPRFRVTWLELFISMFVPTAGILALITWASLPPQSVAYLQSHAVLFWQFLQRSRLDWAFLACGLLVVAAFLLVTTQLLRPRFRRPKVVLTIPTRFF